MDGGTSPRRGPLRTTRLSRARAGEPLLLGRGHRNDVHLGLTPRTRRGPLRARFGSSADRRAGVVGHEPSVRIERRPGDKKKPPCLRGIAVESDFTEASARGRVRGIQTLSLSDATAEVTLDLRREHGGPLRARFGSSADRRRSYRLAGLAASARPSGARRQKKTYASVA